CENTYQKAVIKNIQNVQNLLHPSHTALCTSLDILGNLEPPIGPGASIFSSILTFFKLKEISDVADAVFASRHAAPVNSLDPNDKVGATGVGAPRFIAGAQLTNYAIYFDNQPTATAPAQLVTITDALDAGLDLATLTPGPITFATQLVIPPSVPL